MSLEVCPIEYLAQTSNSMKTLTSPSSDQQTEFHHYDVLSLQARDGELESIVNNTSTNEHQEKIDSNVYSDESDFQEAHFEECFHSSTETAGTGQFSEVS